MYTIADRIRPNPIALSLLLILTLTIGACTFHVQPIEKYSSADGYLSLTHPAAWDVIEEDASDGTTTVLLGSNPDLVNVDVVPPGEAGIGIMLMPNFIPEPGLDTMTVGPEDMVALIRDSALQGQTGAEVGEVEQVALADGGTAYRFATLSPESNITVYAFAPAQEMLAVGILIAAAGEEDAALTARAEDVLNSVRFRGDAAEFAERARQIIGGGN